MENDFDDPVPFSEEHPPIAAARKTADHFAAVRAQHAPPSTLIPGYRILREIHRGGQGVVYQARQIATGRDVAIKVFRHGPFSGPREQARFEREVQILSRLRHPNIAVIFDTGYAERFHYFVMDYIPGVSLDQYLDHGKPDLRQRLDLIAEIAHAVHAAHQHGIVHRDLKPGNILIDDDGRPHVVDFGLAKLTTGGPPGSSTMHEMTQDGQFLGSLPWSSPEQVEGRLEDVDVRTDVYGLGAIAYQAVTGRLPFLADQGRARLVRDIIDEAPAPPSAISPEADDEIDTIILTCLSKDAANRYPSTSALADDIKRYLNRLPILARPPSALYQLRKLVRRHRLASLMVLLLFLSLIAFGAGMTLLYQSQSRLLTRAITAEAQARERQQEAEKAAATVSAVNDFLLNDVLSSTAPALAQGRDLTMREILDDASQHIDASLDDQPEVKASVRATIGRCYARLGLFDEADSHLHDAANDFLRLFGPRDRRTLSTQIEWAQVLRSLERDDQARALVGRICDYGTTALIEDDAILLRAKALQAWYLWEDGEKNKARRLFEETVERARNSIALHPVECIALLNNWFNAMRYWGEFRKAKSYLEEALQLARDHLGPRHPQTLRAMTNLGYALAERRQFEEARALLEEALHVQRDVLGLGHIETIRSTIRLCILYIGANRLDDAEAMSRANLEYALSQHGPQHLYTLDQEKILANALMQQAKDGEALDVIKEAYDVQLRVHGPRHARTIQFLEEMSFYLYRLGRYADAEPGLRLAFEHNQEQQSDPASHTPSGTMRKLMLCLAARGNMSEAREITRQLLERRRMTATLPGANAYMLNSYAKDLLIAKPPDMRDPEAALDYAMQARELSTDAYYYNRYTIAEAYCQLGEYEAALPYIRLAMARVPIEDSIERRLFEDTYAVIHEALDNRLAALSMYRELIDARESALGQDHADVAVAMERYATALLRFDEPADAAEWLQNALEIRTRVLSEDHYLIGHTRSLLGEALAEQGLDDKAEAQLVAGYEQMQLDSHVPWTDLRAALLRLVRFYEDRGVTDSGRAYTQALYALEERMGIR